MQASSVGFYTTPYGWRLAMRIPNSTHQAGAWRIHEIVPDFTLEDVWVLPVEGGPEDFDRLLELIAQSDPSQADSPAARALWRFRDLLGEWLDLGRISEPAGANGNG